MPTSDTEGKEWARKVVADLDPQTVVDIGPGEGTYASLLRPVLPDARLIGVEVWGPYIPKYDLFSKYDWIITGDVRHVDLYSIDVGPDLVIMGDILEHMPAVEASIQLQRMTAWADHLLVSVPVRHFDQGPYQGNWYEVHHDHWTYKGMLEELSPGVVDSVCGDILAYYLWSAEAAGGGL